jgi:hypothetical protein
MVQTRAGTKTYSKEKSALQKINDLCLVGYGRDLYEFLRPNKTINSEVYCQQLDRVNECLKEKQRPHLVSRKVIFHQDNARPHVSKMTQQKINAILAYFESKPRSFYKAGIEKLVTRWETVIASNGNYIID